MMTPDTSSPAGRPVATPEAIDDWFRRSGFGERTEAGRAKARRALSALDAGAFSGLDEATRTQIRGRLAACLRTP
ncbi:MAG: hypothetical protein AAF791_04740 [Bacteroidota bacterium]